MKCIVNGNPSSTQPRSQHLPGRTPTNPITMETCQTHILKSPHTRAWKRSNDIGMFGCWKTTQPCIAGRLKLLDQNVILTCAVLKWMEIPPDYATSVWTYLAVQTNLPCAINKFYNLSRCWCLFWLATRNQCVIWACSEYEQAQFLLTHKMKTSRKRNRIVVKCKLYQRNVYWKNPPWSVHGAKVLSPWDLCVLCWCAQSSIRPPCVAVAFRRLL